MNRVYKYFFWSFVGVCAMVLAIVSPLLVRGYRERKNVEMAFNNYVAALSTQRFDVAYKLCGNQFRKVTPYGQFVDQQKSIETQYGSLVSAHQLALDVEGKGSPMLWKAVIDAEFVYQKKTIRFELVFRKNKEGRWALYGIQRI